MALRLIEIFHSEGKADEIDFLLKDLPILDTWHDHLDENQSVTNVLVKTENTEKLLDTIQKFFPESSPPRIVILPVEATLPRPEEPESEEREEEQRKNAVRISTEELYQKLSVVSSLSKKYVIMTTLASFVAAIGLLKNDVAVIIGSMVIAPLFSPNMALALSTTLADYELAKKAVITNISGFFVVFLVGIVTGLLLTVDPSIVQIAKRSDVSNFYIFIALATGIAGAYSITTGVAEALVGVMVAVALLPPLVAAGLLFGAHHTMEGVESLLLCFVNIVSINLAGVITFVFQGIRPKNWWEAKKAKKAVRVALMIWVFLLIVLAGLISLAHRL